MRRQDRAYTARDLLFPDSTRRYVTDRRPPAISHWRKARRLALRIEANPAVGPWQSAFYRKECIEILLPRFLRRQKPDHRWQTRASYNPWSPFSPTGL